MPHQLMNEFGFDGRQHAMDFMQSVEAAPADPSELIVVLWNVTPVHGPRAVMNALMRLGLSPLRVRPRVDDFEGAVVVCFAAEWQANVCVSKLPRSRSLMDPIGQNACVAKWTSKGVPTLLRMALKDLPRVPDHEPAVDPDDDPYDPRKPEYITEVSPADADASQSRIVRHQIKKLQGALSKRTSELEPRVRKHYELVLDEMRRAADEGCLARLDVESDSGLCGADSPIMHFGHSRAWSEMSLSNSEESDLTPESNLASDAETDCSFSLSVRASGDANQCMDHHRASRKDGVERAGGSTPEDTDLELDLQDFHPKNGRTPC